MHQRTISNQAVNSQFLVRGFALTLALGIIVSLFSAIFITRIFLQVFVGNWTEKIKWIL